MSVKSTVASMRSSSASSSWTDSMNVIIASAYASSWSKKGIVAAPGTVISRAPGISDAQ